ncbi:MAG: outer membrane lipoprotein carrier protein LolA [Prevotella sp.]|nr:outer membrane lipoprotein carrier protein LolA [Prevotella sp.]
MKRLFFIVLVAVFSLHVSGQTKLTAEQQKQLVEKIDKAASAMKSMQCDFTQTKSMKLLKKEMKSNGVMYFKQPNKLRWQYTSPYDYTFIMNGDKVRIKSTKSTQDINVQGNKILRQITNIILNTVTGGGLKSASDFTVEVYKSDKGYFAKLYPKKKEVKQIYNVIEIYFNSSLTMVSSVRMIEKTGDETLVNLNNLKANVAINEKMFAVD